ncbi:uncharacterized protein LOC116938787 [Petromyzon marinus]|uniref:Uncharacterized protein LOC116938787 n=1 Tax=Petromyzon marinus TaxID=7757 RepID=A0AAJ7SP88_PETMA|nr:uncharacterized protein LOC116938787 [Petromyzon marinus]
MAELFPKLRPMLPDGFKYKVVSYEDGPAEQFCSELRVSIDNKDATLDWIRKFEATSMVTWRIRHTFPESGRKNIFKNSYRCQHKTNVRRSLDAKRTYRTKNTNCPAVMTVILKRLMVVGKSRSKDKLLPDFPLVVKLTFKHNHPIKAADTLKYRDVAKETREKLLRLFKSGYTPSVARDMMQDDLQLEAADEYSLKASDRSVCPDISFCFSLYYQSFQKVRRMSTGNEMLQDVLRRADEYNQELGKECVRMQMIGEQNCVIAVCTPFMARVHTLAQAGDVAFVDSPGGMDRRHCKIFIFLAHSPVGGLPLGCLITTSEAEEVILTGLKLLQCLWPPNAFCGRGPFVGPQIFIADDTKAEMNAIRGAFPGVPLLLNIFHVLQAAWRWLWNRMGEVPMGHRSQLFFWVKRLIHAESISDLTEQLQLALQYPLVVEHTRFQQYITKLFEWQKEWVLCCISGLPSREAAMRILKDKVLYRTRSLNLPQLLDFTVNRMSMYYEKRIYEVCNGRLEHAVLSCYDHPGESLSMDSILQIGPSEFRMPSTTKPDVTFVVDTSASCCSCSSGISGGPCKHQYAVMKKFGVQCPSFLSVSAEAKQQIYRIATGCADVPLECFTVLQSPTTCHVETETAAFAETPDASPVDGISVVEITQPASPTVVTVAHGELLQLCYQMFLEKSGIMLRDDPVNGGAALQVFLEGLSNIHTGAAMVSALRNFGKFSADMSQW